MRLGLPTQNRRILSQFMHLRAGVRNRSGEDLQTSTRLVLAGLVGLATLPAHAATSGARRTKIDSIVVHAISGPSCAGGQVRFSGAPGDATRWKRFFDTHPFLGIHYVVDRAGHVLASTPEERQANHALDNNAGSIGIELVHDGDGREPFGEAQLAALIKLLAGIVDRHGIAIENVRGHADVDTRTFTCGGAVHKGRSDPGPNFPWIRVLAAFSAQKPALATLPSTYPAPRLLAKPRQVEPPYGLNGPGK